MKVVFELEIANQADYDYLIELSKKHVLYLTNKVQDDQSIKITVTGYSDAKEIPSTFKNRVQNILFEFSVVKTLYVHSFKTI